MPKTKGTDHSLREKVWVMSDERGYTAGLYGQEMAPVAKHMTEAEGHDGPEAVLDRMFHG
ncbi:MAG: hypothetical protein SWE60_02455 [Thermodesulfobacteriota bacterium]|nr:hypothetical protein [Thermodesulfobacteriota bacterium]